MLWLRTYRRSLAIASAVTVVDLAAHFTFDLEMSHVLVIETVCFLFGSAMLLWAAKQDKQGSFKARRVDLWLALAFALGGIRAALWAAGAAVYVANLVILGLGVILALQLVVWTRRSAGPAAPKIVQSEKEFTTFNDVCSNHVLEE